MNFITEPFQNCSTLISENDMKMIHFSAYTISMLYFKVNQTLFAYKYRVSNRNLKPLLNLQIISLSIYMRQEIIIIIFSLGIYDIKCIEIAIIYSYMNSVWIELHCLALIIKWSLITILYQAWWRLFYHCIPYNWLLGNIIQDLSINILSLILSLFAFFQS